MATISPLADAVDALVRDGLEIALEGPCPAATVHEMVRRAPRGLTLVATDPGEPGDRLVAAGCVERLVTARTVGPAILAALADGRLELEEHTLGGLAARYAAGAAGLPFGTVRSGYADTDLGEVSPWAPVRCPFTGERLTALRALRPDLAIVHGVRADRAGNVQLDRPGAAAEAVLAARSALVTVCELVDELPTAAGTVLPGFAVTAVAVVPK